MIDAASLDVSPVSGLGTSLFEVSPRPGSDLIYVPNTDARNFVRFEHELGVRGHIVDTYLTVVDAGDSFSLSRIDLNSHIDRSSDPE
ncbi:MAG: hypothetical protein GWN87_13050, partial [Desulfuromonadales bacterium]|nr:hypothetical protein [Desulfuromonadales bacterium]